MRKLLILLLMAAATVFTLSACGGGSGSDPLGTDSITLESAASQVDPGATVVLTATVKNAVGATVVGRDVFFGFAPNSRGIAKESGATAGLGGGGGSATNADGKVIITYTAGLNGGTDVIRAWINSGKSAEVSITVGSGGAGGGAGSQIALTGSPSSLSAGQNSILTATVTDGEGNPIVSQDVTFTLFSDNSGATLKALNGTPTDKTDASGNVVAVYTAGTSNPTQTVQDTVKASIVGASTAIILTRTGSGGGGGGGTAGGIKMSITAAPDSLSPGKMSVIIAEALYADNTPVVGETVNFGFVVNNSGAIPLTVVRAQTDATGKAIATYTAGSGSPGISVQDAVTASVTDATGTYSAGAVIITVLTPEAAGTGNRINSIGAYDGVTAISPDSLLPSTTYILKVSIVLDDEVTPIFGEAVTFSTIITSGGGIMRNPDGVAGDPLTVQSDNNGNAYVLFTTPAATPGYAAIRATIAAGSDTALVINW